jgi:hypothetical protein
MVEICAVLVQPFFELGLGFKRYAFHVFLPLFRYNKLVVQLMALKIAKLLDFLIDVILITMAAFFTSPCGCIIRLNKIPDHAPLDLLEACYADHFVSPPSYLLFHNHPARVCAFGYPFPPPR